MMMKDLVLERMDAKGCAPAVRALVERIPNGQPLLVLPSRAARLLVAGSPDLASGLNVSERHVQIKLDVPDGEQFAETWGYWAGTKGPTTYVRVTEAALGDPARQPALDAAVLRALTRRNPGVGQARAADDLFCPETLLALPVTGWCDDCEQVCA